MLTVKNKLNKNVPVMRQMAQTECGITSLAMVFSFYGYEGALSDLRKDVHGSRNGISMLTLKKIAESYHFNVKAMKLNINELQNFQIPLILFWEDNHFLVLEKVKGDNYYLVDPAIGKYILQKEDIESRYSGYALYILPNENFEKRKKKSKPNFNLFLAFYSQKLPLVMMFVIAIIVQLSVIILPITTKYLIDNSVDANNFWDIDNIKLIIFLMIIILLIQILFNYINNYIINKVQKKVDEIMIPSFVKHLVNLPIRYFNSRSTGDLVLRTNNLEDVRMLVLNQMIAGFLNLTTLIVVTNYMFSQSLILSGVLIGVGLIQMALIIFGSKKIQPISNIELSYKSEQNSKLSEMLHSIQTIKSLNEEKTFVEEWEKTFLKKLNATYQVGMKKISMDSVLKSLSVIVPVAITLFGVILTVSGSMTIGSLFSFLSISTIFLMPFTNIAEGIVNINKTKSILNFVEDVATNETEENRGTNEKEILGHIELKNIHFKFDKYSDDLLKNVNLDIPEKSNVAIIGSSGSGKSTLLSLLNKVYRPTSGEIFIDGNNIDSYSIKHLRDSVGIVTQEFSIFNKTIYENITLNNSKYTQKEVLEALDGASLLKEVAEMPQGINTMLSENGSNISGGQRQRIAIARALIKKPKILILDEATSSLDQKNEKAIDSFLKNYGATKITTSHNISTLKNMDKIYLLSKGEVILSGKLDELKDTQEFKKYIGDD